MPAFFFVEPDFVEPADFVEPGDVESSVRLDELGRSFLD
jgi:hypothetical protein